MEGGRVFAKLSQYDAVEDDPTLVYKEIDAHIPGCNSSSRTGKLVPGVARHWGLRDPIPVVMGGPWPA